MGRVDLSSRLFAAARWWFLAPDMLANRARKAHADVYFALRRLGARVRGCGCDADDAEMCGKGGWCTCTCHPENKMN